MILRLAAIINRSTAMAGSNRKNSPARNRDPAKLWEYYETEFEPATQEDRPHCLLHRSEGARTSLLRDGETDKRLICSSLKEIAKREVITWRGGSQLLLRQAQSSFTPMNSQEAFRRFAQQVQRAGGQGGGGFSGGPGRLFAGGGLLAALIGGGLLLNASLFNGASFRSSQSLSESCSYRLKSTVVTVPSSIRGKGNKPI